MKKVVSFLIAILMIMGVATFSNAASSSELANRIYEIAKPYGMTSANKVRIERYLKENPVSDETANNVIAKLETAIKVFKDANATKYSELSTKQKNEIKSIANETATILGLTLKFKAKEVEIYKNGKLIEVARYDDNKYMYTGNSVNPVLVVSSVVAVALVATFALRKKFANA